MTDNPRSISVAGTGSAEAVPDLLTVSIGVECRRETVAEAYSEAGTRSAA
ncbi:SIMPL domain-containing protein, partial [Microbacterium sp. Bi128]